MDWRDLAAEGLPAPHSGEPPGLRQDIQDELSDHLQSALAHELRRTPDEAEATENVLERFGDVRRIARRLWLDAMKGALMSQRITLALVAVVAAACVAACALAWVAVSEGRQVNAAILERLDALAAAPQPEPVPLEWVPVKVQCVLDQEDGPPASGVEVSLSGKVTGEEQLSVARTTGADGIADFGIVRTGTYSVRLSAPSGELGNTGLQVLPGAPVLNRIVCPSSRPARVPVTARIEWPEDLPGRYWVVCDFAPIGRKLEPDVEWHIPLRASPTGHAMTGEQHKFTISPDGTVSDAVAIVSTDSKSRVLFVSGEFVPRTSIELPSNQYRLESILLFELEEGTGLSVRSKLKAGFPLRHSYHPPRPPHFPGPPLFSAKPNRDNVWSIEIPSGLQRQLRELAPNAESEAVEQQ